MLLDDLIAANRESLRESITLLKDITDAAFTEVTLPFASSIGKHMRHVTDHYLQLLKGMPGSHIDYDARVRNGNVEEDRGAMIKLLNEIDTEYSTLKFDPEQAVRVVSSVGKDCDAPTVNSTLAREMVFLQSHTTHHCAIISGILKIQGQFVPDSFGIAASTKKYDQQRSTH